MKKLFAVSMAVLFVIFAAFPVFADKNPSPEPSKDDTVVIHNTNGGTGTYTKDIDEDGKTHVKIKAHPKNGYKFDHWEIDGDYIIVKGKLTDGEMEIIINGDVVITPFFKKGGKTSPGSSTSISRDSSSTSPKTGESGNMLYFMIIVASVFVVLSGAVGVKLALSSKKQ